MNKDALLREITIVDFMALDLHLYLNTHPCDTEALAMYNDCTTRNQKLRKEYEEVFGPLTSFRSHGQSGWAWNREPWPWEEKFNFEMTETL